MNIAVIGAGIGGLVAAIRLAHQGHTVCVYDKNSTPGGKLSEIRDSGYRFDTGPSLFTLPQLLEDLFARCGRPLSQYMDYTLLHNNCKYVFADGTVFDFYHNKEQLQHEVEQKTNEPYAHIAHRLAQSQEQYELGAPVFIFNDFHKLANYNTAPFKRVARKLYKLQPWRSMHQANKRSFRDKRMVQLFDRYATYNGSNPYKAPATLNMIAHLENNIGAFFPSKGMYSIVQSLYQLALDLGVRFCFDSLVTRIVVEQRKAVALEVQGQQIAYDLLVSDADVRYLARHLLHHPLRRRLARATPSSSAIIFYWGINTTFAQVDIHNIFFSHDYKQEFDHLFKHHSLSADPTVYLFVSSKAVPTDAPPGCENWFAMVNAPANQGQDWEQVVQQARASILSRLSAALGTDIASHIVVEHVGSPVSIERQTLSYQGALYGTASNSMFSAFLRHPNTLSGIANLYFVGGSVHPGGGIPLCIASANIVCDDIDSKNTPQA